MQGLRFLLVNAILYYGAVGGNPAFPTIAMSPSTGIGSTVSNRLTNDSLTKGHVPTSVPGPSFVHFGKSDFPGQRLNSDALKTTAVRGVKTQSFASDRRPVDGGRDRPSYSYTGSDLRDDLERFDDTHQNIYAYTLGLLTLGMRTWLDRADRTETGPYLGYSASTANLIDFGVSELMSRRRNGLSVDDLLDTYYYCCDVENVEDDAAAVTAAFQTLLRRYSPMTEQTKNMTEPELAEALKSCLDQVESKVLPEFGVTVPLMKNRIFVEPTDKTAVNRLADTVAEKTTGRTFRQLAESGSKSATGTEINRNHSVVLRYLVLKVFQYAFDYVHVLLKLYEFDLDETDMDAVRSFAPFMERFMSMFLFRFFLFSGTENLNEVYFKIIPMIVFCNPESTTYDKDHVNPNILNFNEYKNNTYNSTDYYRKYATLMVSHALAELVKSLGFGMDTEVSVFFSPIVQKLHSDEKLTKKDCLELLTGVINEGFEILNEYSKYFIKQI